jgi:formamidopyrimidine-DNA glycosylase
VPELPEVESYITALRRRIVGETLTGVRIRSFSLLKTVDPPASEVLDKTVNGLRRIGKRIVIELEDELFLVIHLMVAGRFKWFDGEPATIPKKYGLAAFDFTSGSLLLTEAGTKRRASLHIVRGEEALDLLDPGGIEPAELTVDDLEEHLRRERHTLKRVLTDARLFSGIGGAFADEILHRARLSPLQMSTNLDPDEIVRLHEALVSTMAEWTEIRIRETGDGFPTKVTAFHPEMAVHGKYGEQCPVCGTKVQRIVYASRETNYCPSCQTDGKILADRSLSRLLRDDFPRRIEELEGM